MSRWIPNISDTQVVNKSQRKLLDIAKKRLNKHILREFRDSVGRIGFEVDTHLVMAKGYVYGWVVSFHKSLVKLAFEKNKKILLYIGKNDAFYEFLPATVFDKGTINVRGNEEMLNVDIKSGKRYTLT